MKNIKPWQLIRKCLREKNIHLRYVGKPVWIGKSLLNYDGDILPYLSNGVYTIRKPFYNKIILINSFTISYRKLFEPFPELKPVPVTKTTTVIHELCHAYDLTKRNKKDLLIMRSNKKYIPLREATAVVCESILEKLLMNLDFRRFYAYRPIKQRLTNKEFANVARIVRLMLRGTRFRNMLRLKNVIKKAKRLYVNKCRRKT